MSDYIAEFQPFYTNGWENQPSENTPIMGEALDAYDETLQKIENFLANLDLSGLGGDYALLSEAGYSLGLEIDTNYVMTISLKNKAGAVLDSKNIDFPIESMVVNATYENGVVTFTLQNGNVLNVDISDLVRGLVPTTRKIADIDLADDITAEELVEATRAVSGQVYVDFAEAEQTNPALFEFMPYPIGEDGKKSVGQSGQIYVSNGDGTFSWITLGVAEGGAY